MLTQRSAGRLESDAPVLAVLRFVPQGAASRCHLHVTSSAINGTLVVRAVEWRSEERVKTPDDNPAPDFLDSEAVPVAPPSVNTLSTSACR